MLTVSTCRRSNNRSEASNRIAPVPLRPNGVCTTVGRREKDLRHCLSRPHLRHRAHHQQSGKKIIIKITTRACIAGAWGASQHRSQPTYEAVRWECGAGKRNEKRCRQQPCEKNGRLLDLEPIKAFWRTFAAFHVRMSVPLPLGRLAWACVVWNVASIDIDRPTLCHLLATRFG